MLPPASVHHASYDMPRIQRKRCPECGKVCYAKKDDAHAAIARMPLDSRYMWLNVFRCSLGFLHIGHNHRMLDPWKKKTKDFPVS